MRGGIENICGCFPTGRHYPGIADRIARRVQKVSGLAEPFSVQTPWLEIPTVIVDFETTGTDAKTDRIIEIGAVLFDGGQVTERHAIFVNPEMPISHEASQIHGITDKDVADAPKFAELTDTLLPLLEGRVPVAYNASFDRGFLFEECVRAGVSDDVRKKIPALTEDVEWIDPLVWARELLAELKSKKLGLVCEHLGVSLENAHRAADDAEATGHVLYALSPRMPESYGELIRLQRMNSARQEAEFAARKKFWKS